MNVLKIDINMIKIAEHFLFENNLFHKFNLFCTREMIGREMLHSDRWSMIHDWLESQGIKNPRGVVTALTEYFETTCIHVKTID